MYFRISAARNPLEILSSYMKTLFSPVKMNKPDRNISSEDERLYDLCIGTTALASIYEQQNEIGLTGLVCFLFLF